MEFVAEEGEYKQFNLLGKEMSLTVDMSGAFCGLNGTVYFVEMNFRLVPSSSM